VRAVPSMDHVEVLMRLHEADRELSEAEVVASARLGGEAVTKALRGLVDAGLVRLDAEQHTYRFAPNSADRPAVEELAQLYHQRPVTLVRLVYEMPSTRLRTFADAFRLRDEPKKP
jgi:DNA-binding IclR family transcriptional regulator